MCGTMQTMTEDWQTIKKRFNCWWANEVYDRAVVQVTAPRAGARPNEKWPGGEVTGELRWTNVDYQLWCIEQEIRTTWYGGDRIPRLIFPWSVGYAVFMGCEPVFAEDSVWVKPLAQGSERPELRFAKESRWWHWACQSMLSAAQASQGRYWVTPCYGNSGGDTLAVLRGSENLMMDIALDPTWAKWAVKKTSDILLEAQAELCARAGPDITGLEGWVAAGVWSPGKNLELNCDVSCMVSPGAFENIFLPPLIESAQSVDHVVYEVDGPGALKHLDALLSVPQIEAFSWTPGSALQDEGVLRWIPLLERIVKAGKNIIVGVTPAEVEPLLAAVSAKGLLIRTTCATEQEGRDLVRLVERCSR